MAMLDNVTLPEDGSFVDLYAVTGVTRGDEIRWQNLSNNMVYGHVDDAMPTDPQVAHRKHPPLVEAKAIGSQFVVLWAPNGAEIHVETP